MEKKVLVTGATGFIGNYVVETLLQQGYTVIATSSNETKAAAANWYHRVLYIPFNLNEFDNSVNYFTYFHQPDMLIHLAWEGLPNYKADFHLTKNLPLQKDFLQNLIAHGLRDITVTGTCFEYGMKEGCLNEEMECEPSNAYAIAKNALRLSLEQLTAAYHCSFKWIRLFYMYGKGQSPKSLISQLDKAIENGDEVFNMSGGEQVRDFLRVEEVADYIVASQ
jgi:nucleoside-diphosphate-sugar epimerase